MSTSQGELEHRRVKRYYPRVHKGQFVKGIAKQTRRERILNILTNPTPLMSAAGNPSLPFSQDESMPQAPSDKAYQMSTEIRHKLDISCYLGDHEDDPALTVGLS